MRRTRTTLLARTIVVAALASAATVLALPGGGGAAAQDKPANTTEPRITGTASVGSTLSATTGSWTGNPTGFAFQWVRCPQGGGRSDGSDCASIGGATTSKYIVAAADVDHRLRARVTAANADGQQTVASNATARVRQPDAGRPVNVAIPTLSGTPAQGQALHVAPGTWNGRQPITYTFRWLRCDGAGNNCVIQSGFADDSYALREGDVGKTIRARVIARNSQGEGSRLTAQSAVVQGPQGPSGVITLPNGEKSIPVTSVPTNERLGVGDVFADRCRRPARPGRCDQDHAGSDVGPGIEREPAGAHDHQRRRARRDPQQAPVRRAGSRRRHARLRRPRRAGLPSLDAARDPERAGAEDGSGRMAAADRDARA